MLGFHTDAKRIAGVQLQPGLRGKHFHHPPAGAITELGSFDLRNRRISGESAQRKHCCKKCNKL